MSAVLIRCRLQQGVALVLSLVLLLVLTILGIAGMSNVLMQERMASNVNLQTLAFEAASAGISQSLDYGLNTDNWPSPCTRGGTEWITADWEGPFPLTVDDAPEDIVVQFRQRLGCFEDETFSQFLADNEMTDIPLQVLVLSRGEVVRCGSPSGGVCDNPDEILAMREIEVRVENRGGDPLCGIQVQGQVDHSLPNSGAFSIDGSEGGCPLQTEHCSDADEMKDSLRDNQIGLYKPNPPGISCGRGGQEPWNDPDKLAHFANRIKWSIRHIDDGYDQNGFPLIDPDDPESGEILYDGMDETGVSPAQLGTCGLADELRLFTGNHRVQGGNRCSNGAGDSTNLDVSDITDGITYIAGDLRMGGNPSGTGIIIVEGSICWNGRAEFEGLIVALSGHFEMDGGGNGETEGNVVIANISDLFEFPDGPPDYLKRWYDPDKSNGNFGPSVLDFSGGGNHLFKSSCESLADKMEELNSCLTEPIPIQDCGPEGIGKRKAIASWREYIDRQRWDE